jgi:hypothetical protein
MSEVTTENTAHSEMVSIPTMAALGFVGVALEAIQTQVPQIHEILPEALDISDHAGNMWVGAAVAAAATIGYAVKNRVNDDFAITAESMSRFRKVGVPIVLGATAALNCITETKWGVKHLPVDNWLNAPYADPLDTLYSTVWGGVLSLAFWRKVKTNPSEQITI